MLAPNSEQTSSPLSLIFFLFLDPLIFKAYKVPHLAYEQLPPLADYDYAHVLKKKSFPVRCDSISFRFITDASFVVASISIFSQGRRSKVSSGGYTEPSLKSVLLLQVSFWALFAGISLVLWVSMVF
jgi:hypothetical protein